MSNQKYKACPFCGSTDLSENLWELDQGEVDAVECNKCFAGAPVTSWENRHEPDGRIQRRETNRAA